MRTCTACGDTKPLDEFYRNSNCRQERAWQCKPCTLARVRAYREANLETVRARKKAYREAQLASYRLTRGDALKSCFQCAIEKPLTDFGPARGVCKACVAADARRRRADNPQAQKAASKRWRQSHPEQAKAMVVNWRRENPERHRDQRRRWATENADRLREASKRWAADNLVRMRPSARARKLVYKAIRRGKLIRSTSCENCGANDGRIEAAHADYSKPLDVRWLCVPCHRRWDALDPKTKGVAS
jgi:hypothetical protein